MCRGLSIIVSILVYHTLVLCTAASDMQFSLFVSQSPKCGQSQQFTSVSVRSRVQCVNECQHRMNQHQQLQQLAPCVGVNYRDTEAACDVFEQEPTTYSKSTPGCQYIAVQSTNQPHSSNATAELGTTVATSGVQITTPAGPTKQATGKATSITTSMSTKTTTSMTVHCPSPQWYNNFGNCYYVDHITTVDFTTARNACHGMGAELTSVNNASENNYISDISNGTVWIGLYKKSTFMMNPGQYWLDGSTSTYINWYPAEPDQFTLCVRMAPDGTFKDTTCMMPFNYVCKKPEI